MCYIPWKKLHEYPMKSPCFMVKSCFFSTISLGEVPNPPRLPCRRAPHRPSCLVLHLPLDREMSKNHWDVIMAISLDMEKNMQIFNWDVFWMYINIMGYHIISYHGTIFGMFLFLFLMLKGASALRERYLWFGIVSSYAGKNEWASQNTSVDRWI